MKNLSKRTIFVLAIMVFNIIISLAAYNIMGALGWFVASLCYYAWRKDADLKEQKEQKDV